MRLTACFVRTNARGRKRLQTKPSACQRSTAAPRLCGKSVDVDIVLADATPTLSARPVVQPPVPNDDFTDFSISCEISVDPDPNGESPRVDC